MLYALAWAGGQIFSSFSSLTQHLNTLYKTQFLKQIEFSGHQNPICPENRGPGETQTKALQLRGASTRGVQKHS